MATDYSNGFFPIGKVEEKEIWKTNPNPKFKGYFQGSNKGRIKSLARIVPMSDGRKYTVPEKILTQSFQNNYYSVCLTVDGVEHNKGVHAFLLECFVGLAPEGMLCRHLDGNSLNNSLENLCWGTQQENNEDQAKHGTYVTGRKGNSYKITGKTEEIKAMRVSGYKIREIADRFQVTHNTIWNHLRKR